jgi:predicted ATP-dependent protease
MADFARKDYCAAMSMILRKLAHYVAQKAASDPEAREKVLRAAGGVVEQAKQIAKEDNRAYAAGKAVRRAFDKLQKNR